MARNRTEEATRTNNSLWAESELAAATPLSDRKISTGSPKMKFWFPNIYFGSDIDPKASIWMKMDGNDSENHEEFQDMAQLFLRSENLNHKPRRKHE